MNTLNGYSKSTLSDLFTLTASGGHFPIHEGRNNEKNKLVRTDASGYILAGWINTLSGDMGTTAATRIYCSNDAYIRYKTLANFSSDIAGQLYWANVKVSTSSNAATSPTFNTCYTSNWFRSTGSTGWYSETYGGGWYMNDSTWIRSYNNKSVYIDSGIFYNLGNAYFACTATNKIGIGTTSPTEKLHIVGDRIYWTNGDATLKIYGVDTCCGKENVAFQSTFNGQDPLSSSYVTSYRTRSAILLLPRGGNVGINITHDPSDPLTVGGNVSATHFYESSDIRYKIITSDLSIKSSQLANLPLFNFKWKDNKDLLNTGTSAQAVQAILPNIVSGTDKLTLDYGVLGTIAGITACKELVIQKSEIELLKDRIELLEQQLKMYHGNSK